jgi:hypothetical protein
MIYIDFHSLKTHFSIPQLPSLLTKSRTPVSPAQAHAPPHTKLVAVAEVQVHLPRERVDGALRLLLLRASRSPSTARSFASTCPFCSRASSSRTFVSGGGDGPPEVPSDSTPVFTSRLQSRRFRSTFPASASTTLYICSFSRASRSPSTARSIASACPIYSRASSSRSPISRSHRPCEKERDGFSCIACFVFLLCESFGAARRCTAGLARGRSRRIESRRLQLHTDGSRGAAHAWLGYLYTRALGRCTPQ